MSKEPRVQELITLKTIAETLNQMNEPEPMLNTALEKLLELTGLETGWIYLIEGRKEYSCVADFQLPPGLQYEDKSPMRCGMCWCVDRYCDDRLKNAVNILSCKRLEDATSHGWGDTHGITHHATVPLQVGDRKFGLLNVASPDKEHFNDEELALLQSIAFQISGALERTRLYLAEQKRANLFLRLGEFSRSLGAVTSRGGSPDELAEEIISLIGHHFDWPVSGLIEVKSKELNSESRDFVSRIIQNRHYLEAKSSDLQIVSSLLKYPGLTAGMAAPVVVGTTTVGVILIGDSKKSQIDRVDGQVLEALAEHIAMAVETIELEEHRRELARLEERNRLARDLHDSVSQMLFSLSMTAKGVESLLQGPEPDMALSAVRDMQTLSQNALKEMRALIMQLRPAGLEAGVTSALKAYGESLNLRVTTQLIGVQELPRSVEEVLWRIGQEALNNVSKHSKMSAAEVKLELKADQAILIVSDQGIGILKKRQNATSKSIGLQTMRERAEAVGGTFRLMSKFRKGTTIEVTIPLPAVSRMN